MNVALIQMDIALGQPAANRRRVAELVKEAAVGADLVMLPEMWTTGYALPELAGNLADREGEPTGALLAELARTYAIYLVGSVPIEREGRIYNTATIYGPDGQLLAAYEKIHLVPLMDEHLYLTPGERRVVADVGALKAGLAICYDLRFPELFRSLALDGAQLMLVPAEWPTPRIEHWRLLLRARAIENQCYVLGCNRIGSDHAYTFPGCSMVVDPMGNILVEGEVGAEAILRARIEPEKIAEARARIPVFADRRPHLYRLAP